MTASARRVRRAAFASTLLAAGCATAPSVVAPTSAAEVGEIRPGSGLLNGYLAPRELPDSLALLPPPPAEGSPALAADGAAFRALTPLQGTPRGTLAERDANLAFPAAAATFACALGMPISEQATPNLNMLLRRTLTDAGLATYKAKDTYRRTRPFVEFKTGSCTPGEEDSLRNDGSYPSGHSSIGWAWALVLAEIAPERADALLQRGRAFSQSRAICGVHWQSDIEAGRLTGAATVARLHANPVFVAQMQAAQREIANARRGDAPGDCAAEAAALASSSRIAP
jgi:acid phosphatase (class A)